MPGWDVLLGTGALIRLARARAGAMLPAAVAAIRVAPDEGRVHVSPIPARESAGPARRRTGHAEAIPC